MCHDNLSRFETFVYRVVAFCGVFYVVERVLEWVACSNEDLRDESRRLFESRRWLVHKGLSVQRPKWRLYKCKVLWSFGLCSDWLWNRVGQSDGDASSSRHGDIGSLSVGVDLPPGLAHFHHSQACPSAGWRNPSERSFRVALFPLSLRRREEAKYLKSMKTNACVSLAPCVME